MAVKEKHNLREQFILYVSIPSQGKNVQSQQNNFRKTLKWVT